MAYLIDTDVVIDQLARDPATVAMLDQLAPAGLVISMVTYMEVLQGILEGPDSAFKESEFDLFTEEVPIAVFSRRVARRCAQLRVDLKRQQRRVRPGAIDLLTAATALEHGYTLVTRNRADYADVPGLTFY